MLCRLAQEDASVLPLPLPDQIFGFHAQQSCEKFFKALIAAKGLDYPLTHSLERLAAALEESSETLPNMPYDVLLLEPFAVLKSAAAQFKAEALSAKLCHLDDEFVYEIALLHRDGRFVHVVMNATTGKFIGLRHGREPMSKM